jgi:hypothetical protein
MLKPNFFIVGAPKSGTTSLYDYLKKHPNVFFPKKEICFFSNDLTMRTPHLRESVYLSYYIDARDRKAVGDGFVYHLLSHISAQEIKSFNPDAKIIMMLRNPAQMVYSLHSQLFYNGDEPIESFEKALDAESSRKAGSLIPEYHKCPLESLYYSEVAKYSEQLMRYKTVFAKDKILVILFDDFRFNPELEYRKVLKFLELEEIMPDTFEVVNANKTTKSRAFLQFLINPPDFLKAIAKALFPHHTKRREWLIENLWNLNTRYKPRNPLTKELKQRLIDIYKEDIEKLGKILNRDLSEWLKV